MTVSELRAERVRREDGTEERMLGEYHCSIRIFFYHLHVHFGLYIFSYMYGETILSPTGNKELKAYPSTGTCAGITKIFSLCSITTALMKFDGTNGNFSY